MNIHSKAVVITVSFLFMNSTMQGMLVNKLSKRLAAQKYSSSSKENHLDIIEGGIIKEIRTYSLPNPRPMNPLMHRVITQVAHKRMIEKKWCELFRLYNTTIKCNFKHDELENMVTQTASIAFLHPNMGKNERPGTGYDDTSHINNAALAMFETLVAKGQAIGIAKQTAVTASADSDEAIRSNALDLFNFLVDKNYAFEEATQAAANGLADSNSNIAKKSRDLLELLSKLQCNDNETRK